MRLSLEDCPDYTRSRSVQVRSAWTGRLPRKYCLVRGFITRKYMQLSRAKSSYPYCRLEACSLKLP